MDSRRSCCRTAEKPAPAGHVPGPLVDKTENQPHFPVPPVHAIGGIPL